MNTEQKNSLGKFLQSKFGGKFVQSRDESQRVDIQYSNLNSSRLTSAEDIILEEQVLREVRKCFTKKDLNQLTKTILIF